MIGGAGNDTYFVDNAKDVIDDQGATTDEDTVIVMATITYKLATNVENAELNDTAGAASLTGNTLGNDLTGTQKTRTHQKRELATLKILSLVGMPGTVCTVSVNGFAEPAFELDLPEIFTFMHQTDFSG